jgi:hypothetical protein
MRVNALMALAPQDDAAGPAVSCGFVRFSFSWNREKRRKTVGKSAKIPRKQASGRCPARARWPLSGLNGGV